MLRDTGPEQVDIAIAGIEEGQMTAAVAAIGEVSLGTKIIRSLTFGALLHCSRAHSVRDDAVHPAQDWRCWIRNMGRFSRHQQHDLAGRPRLGGDAEQVCR